MVHVVFESMHETFAYQRAGPALWWSRRCACTWRQAGGADWSSRAPLVSLCLQKKENSNIEEVEQCFSSTWADCSPASQSLKGTIHGWGQGFTRCVQAVGVAACHHCSRENKDWSDAYHAVLSATRCQTERVSKCTADL